MQRDADLQGLGEVIGGTEPGFALVECFATGNQCTITGCCRLPRALNHALGAFLDPPDRHTPASIALEPREFRRVLAPAG